MSSSRSTWVEIEPPNSILLEDVDSSLVHVVYAKQDKPSGQSLALPEKHGWAQDNVASKKVTPQKNDSGSIMEHVVYAKHAWPIGHSVEEPLGQGVAHLTDASLKLKPQKKESPGTSTSECAGEVPSSHVVYL